MDAFLETDAHGRVVHREVEKEDEEPVAVTAIAVSKYLPSTPLDRPVHADVAAADLKRDEWSSPEMSKSPDVLRVHMVDEDEREEQV